MNSGHHFQKEENQWNSKGRFKKIRSDQELEVMDCSILNISKIQNIKYI